MYFCAPFFSFFVLFTPVVTKNSKIHLKNADYSPGHRLVCPTYKESPETVVATNYNVMRILQHFGLLLTCH